MRVRSLLGCCGLLGLLGAPVACRRASRTVATPANASVPDGNVLLITLDTTRADHLSCYAQESANPTQRFARTPNFDALAHEGIRFEHATAQVPLTLPSHACIFTGTYPEVNGMRDMGGFVLNPRVQTLAAMAEKAGMLTAAFVGSKAVAHQYGLARGFDLYDDQMPALRMARGPYGIMPERRASVTTDHALDWLRQHGRQRFFLWVHYYDPHYPHDPPGAYRRSYANDLYSGEIAYTDAQAGRLLDFLTRQNLRSRTLVIVTADHGEGLFQHGEGEHGVFLYDDTLRIPLIISGPGVPPGRAARQQVRSIDIFPTVAEFLGVAPAPDVQGVSLWPLIKTGRELPGKGSDFAYLETLFPKTHMHWSELRGMRTDRWKLIVAPHPELYDLEHDPAEKENVIAQHPGVAEELQRKIGEVVGRPGQAEKVAYNPLDRKSRRELESLGYVSAGPPRQIVLDSSGPDPKDHLATLRALYRFRRLMDAGDFAKAAGVMARAIPADSGDPALRMGLAKAYESQRDWALVVETCQAAEKAGIVTGPLMAFEGEGYLRERELVQAATAMEKASRLDPTDLDNLYNLGTVYLDLRHPRRARRSFRAMLALDGRNAPAYEGLGLAAIERDEVPAAVRDFRKAIAADPNDPDPLLELGVLCREAGNNDLALHYLKKFLAKASPEVYGQVIPKVRAEIKELQPST